jgi:hypothetical protein
MVEAQGNDGHPIVEAQGSKSKNVTLQVVQVVFCDGTV